MTTNPTTAPIVFHPDARLRQISEPVDAITPEILELAKTMVATMRESRGIGLAAIQIGVPLRIIVVQIDETPVAMVNPEIVGRSDGEVTTPEGCLSLPGLTIDVPRAAAIDLRYTDLAGKVREGRLDAMAAICVQHELDHLDGRLILDRASRTKRQMYEKKLAKAKR